MQLDVMRRCLTVSSIYCVCILCICTPWDWLIGLAGNTATIPFCVSATSSLVAAVLLSRLVLAVDSFGDYSCRAFLFCVPEFAKLGCITLWWSFRAAVGGGTGRGDRGGLPEIMLVLFINASTVVASYVVMRRAMEVGKVIGWKYSVQSLWYIWHGMVIILGVVVPCHIASYLVPSDEKTTQLFFVLWFCGIVTFQVLKMLLLIVAGPVFFSVFKSMGWSHALSGGAALERECKYFKRMALEQFAGIALSLAVMFCQIIAMATIARGFLAASAGLTFTICFSADSLVQIILVNVLLGTFKAATETDRSARKTALLRKLRQNEFSCAYERCTDEGWQTVVEDLAHQGFRLCSLLEFYKRLPQIMAQFDPSVHTTIDVVRSAIIPDSADESCSYAHKMSGGVPIRPKRMVTHSWSNLFRDLVAAVVADALRQPTYELIAYLLMADMPTLERALDEEALSTTYWVCAFSVNQHRSICRSNPYGSKDSKTGLEHGCCACGSTIYLNDTPPLRRSDGKSIMCQMNKFDDMIAFLSATDASFSQVIAVDRRCGLFNRAWCVAELATADSIGMQQNMKLASREALESDTERLKNLDVSKMQAARAEDVTEILERIPDVAAFNARLQELILGEQGLFGVWSSFDIIEQGAELARVALFADACRKRPPPLPKRWRVEDI